MHVAQNIMKISDFADMNVNHIIIAVQLSNALNMNHPCNNIYALSLFFFFFSPHTTEWLRIKLNNVPTASKCFSFPFAVSCAAFSQKRYFGLCYRQYNFVQTFLLSPNQLYAIHFTSIFFSVVLTYNYSQFSKEYCRSIYLLLFTLVYYFLATLDDFIMLHGLPASIQEIIFISEMQMKICLFQ